MAGRIEAYGWTPSGTAETGATHPPWGDAGALGAVLESAPSTTYWQRITSPKLLHSSPSMLTALLAGLSSQSGATLTGAYSPSTRRVTLTGSVNWRPVVRGTVGPEWFGLTQSLASGWATSWVGASAPAAVLQCASLRVEPAEDGAATDTERYRHGRVRIFRTGNTLLHTVTAVWHTNDHSVWQAGYVRTGRIKCFPLNASGAYSATNPTGELEGQVLGVSRLERVGPAHWSAELLIATER